MVFLKYEEDTESKELKCLLVRPEDPGIENLLEKLNQTQIQEVQSGVSTEKSGGGVKKEVVGNSEETELDR